jgi:hypothetical protein
MFLRILLKELIMKNLKAQVLIIGAVITGSGVARDLALRGVHCIVVEKGDIHAGASGADHGLLQVWLILPVEGPIHGFLPFQVAFFPNFRCHGRLPGPIDGPVLPQVFKPRPEPHRQTGGICGA